MSVDKAIREMVRDEVHSAVAPLVDAIQRLQANGDVVARLSAALGGGGGGVRSAKLLLGAGRGGKGRRTRGPRGSNDRGCALQGCKRPARSKGYCAAHYQKYRMLARTHRLPSDWTEHAAPSSVKDVVLPRGRAGAKALAEARKK
ncbi:MAG: cell wall protein [Myxococcaceae bacterium]